ncbi:MAG: cytosine permease [Verrucomicrobiota bacterium]
MSQKRGQKSHPSPRLHNPDLAPLKKEARTWGEISLFNAWSNTSQSLLGYTLAASLFLNYGLSGGQVFAALIVSALIVTALVSLVGKPSVRYGIPYPVMARASMGVYSANFPALLRGFVAIFWYGTQTYVASTAISLLMRHVTGSPPSTSSADSAG